MREGKQIILTEEMLEKYIVVADTLLCRQIQDDLENVDIEREFSDKFDRKMEKLIKRAVHSKMYRRSVALGRQAAVVILTVFLFGFAVTMSVEAFREKLFSFIFIEREDGFWEWNFLYEEEADNEDVFLKKPEYIPQGYVLTDYSHELPIWYERYEDEQGGIIMVDNQQVLDGMTMIMDIGYEEEEQIVIQGHTVTLLTAYGDSTCYVLFWFEKNMYYQVYTTTDISKEEVIKIAEGMK